jgi:hypothetical protein
MCVPRGTYCTDYIVIGMHKQAEPTKSLISCDCTPTNNRNCNHSSVSDLSGSQPVMSSPTSRFLASSNSRRGNSPPNVDAIPEHPLIPEHLSVPSAVDYHLYLSCLLWWSTQQDQNESYPSTVEHPHGGSDRSENCDKGILCSCRHKMSAPWR